MISLGHQRRLFRLSLTPMIDVVFLLLVFFMLAARFGIDEAVTLSPPTSGRAYEGAPRLVTIAPDGLRLNGSSVAPEGLSEALGLLMSDTAEAVVLRPVGDVGLQRLVDVITRLNRAGLSNLVVVE